MYSNINNLNISGLYVSFREISMDDTDFIVSIRSDPNLNNLSLGINKEIHKQWYDNYYCKTDNDIYWIVYDKNNGKKIGTQALYNIDLSSKKAETGRTIILKDYRIITFDVIYTVLKFGFCNLELNKIYGYVRNKNILNTWKVVGFKEEGYLRQHYWDGNQYVDLYIISMLKSEFEQYEINTYPKYITALKRIYNI